MKTNVTYVPREQYESILTAKGLSWRTQSGFLRVDGNPGNRIYVAATKKVGRVDISGFEVELGRLAKTPHCGPFGAVKQQLRLDGTPEECLARFGELCDLLIAQPTKEAPPKAKKAPAPAPVEAAPASLPDSSPVDQLVDEEKAKRMALIAKVAAEKGVGISTKTLAQAAE